MSFATRVILATFSLSALASAVGVAGCSGSAGTDAREATGATAEGIVGRCSPGYQCVDTVCDYGPGGKVICTCECAPVPPPSPKAVAVNPGDGGCILLSNGSVQCWTGGTYFTEDAGGLGYAPPNYTLASIPLPKSATSIATGGYTNEEFGCAVLSDSTVWCWGANAAGTLGSGSSQPSATPKQVVTSNGDGGLTPLLATQISANGLSACAITTGGGLACWGDDSFGQLGNGALIGQSAVAIPAGPFPASVTGISVGQRHACALLADGSVFCWGDNGGYGGPSWDAGPSLGIPGVTAHYVPTPGQVAGLPPASAISAGYLVSCATAGGNFYCWGMVGWSQLYPLATSPFYVNVSPAPAGFAADGPGACVISNETPYCWGISRVTGQYVWPTSQGTAPLVQPPPSITALALGQTTACMITTGGQVDCVGGGSASLFTVY